MSFPSHSTSNSDLLILTRYDHISGDRRAMSCFSSSALFGTADREAFASDEEKILEPRNRGSCCTLSAAGLWCFISRHPAGGWFKLRREAFSALLRGTVIKSRCLLSNAQGPSVLATRSVVRWVFL